MASAPAPGVHREDKSLCGRSCPIRMETGTICPEVLFISKVIYFRKGNILGQRL
ncbi:hypothetical protein HMPREF9374_4001 [Desmospora sp. 8437]|nr:hypothetical protein HMPREF9374_4001 [Desmospora sp. 8437]